MLAGVTDCRRSRKWGCRGRRALGFKPRNRQPNQRGLRGFGRETTRQLGRNRLGPCSLGELGPHDFGVLSFAKWLRQQEILCLEEKGRKELLVGHEKVPHGSGLNGDPRRRHSGWCWNPRGCLSHGLLLLFLRHVTPDWPEGEGRTVHL